MSETLMTCCAAQGVELNAEHVAVVEKIGDGTLLKTLLALVKAYGPKIAAVMPQVLADIAAGNYVAAMILIFSSLANQPAPTT